MVESLFSSSEKSGLPPGTLVHVGSVLETEPRISIISYDRDTIVERDLQTAEEVLQYKDSNRVTWVNIEGLTNIGLIEKIGNLFGVHPLVLEDILNTHQRPKFEEHDNCLYIVLKCLLSESDTLNIHSEQVSILIFNNVVFTFKEKKDHLLNSVYQRIKTSNGRFRSLGTDYLAYVILDTIVDLNFILLDRLDEGITSIEDELLNSAPSQETLTLIHYMKKETIKIRRFISPMRELMVNILRSESELIKEKTQVYLRDVSDHVMRIIELTELNQDILMSMMDIYMSSTSNRMNEIMKVLTIFSTIFIPLTFLTGIYGMNFEYMPELKLKSAYPVIWFLFFAIPFSLLLYFRKKKWI